MDDDISGLDLSDDAVFVRTRKGQRELVSPMLPLSSWEHRFLGCVTGLTPLRSLLELGLGGVEARDGILHLLRLGLIAPVDERRAPRVAGGAVSGSAG